MDARTIARKLSKIGALAAVVSSASALIVGCNQSDAQAAKEKAGTKVAEEAAPQNAPSASNSASPSPAAASSYKEEAFELTLTPPDSIAVGKPLEFKITLVPQAGYKVNEEYPIKFKFDETSGVKPAKDTVKKEDSKVDKKQAEIPLVVTIESAGKHKVSGKLSFSVCTEERCLIEKRDLSLEVDAS